LDRERRSSAFGQQRIEDAQGRFDLFCTDAQRRVKADGATLFTP
jgi:hypothetical protein